MIFNVGVLMNLCPSHAEVWTERKTFDADELAMIDIEIDILSAEL